MNADVPIYCQASLNYASHQGITPIRVNIHDGRARADWDWQTHGFELLMHQSAVTNWDDDQQIESIHYAELAELAKQLSGCKHTVVSGHINRNPEQAAKHDDYAPIEYVHSDFTDNYGERVKQRYAQGLEIEQQALARAGISLDTLQAANDLLILQFWRNVGATHPDRPLAFCDAQSVPRTDLYAFNVPNYAGGDFEFDTFGVLAPDDTRTHQWSTFPELTAHEVVAFRTFDSRCVSDGTAYWTPHSAFVDPTAATDAPPRRSIEVRVTCLF